ncbi:MAG: DUF4176 domain-containing protein [Streptococcaceae bacterium]|jgi:hypothetical protein|nr:DUF4176 domain-containing protein [Streptococcaceae bacterium]
MIDPKDYLPLGSIVALKTGKGLGVIIGQGPMVKTRKNAQKETYYDYIVGSYPKGVTSDMRVVTDHDRIKRVIFRGYEDEESKQALVALSEKRKGIKENFFYHLLFKNWFFRI